LVFEVSGGIRHEIFSASRHRNSRVRGKKERRGKGRIFPRLSLHHRTSREEKELHRIWDLSCIVTFPHARWGGEKKRGEGRRRYFYHQFLLVRPSSSRGSGTRHSRAKFPFALPFGARWGRKKEQEEMGSPLATSTAAQAGRKEKIMRQVSMKITVAYFTEYTRSAKKRKKKKEKKGGKKIDRVPRY